MTTLASIHHGTVNAHGFVLDVTLVGEAEARRRVLAAWSTGARLLALPTGAWLLVLDEPVEVRIERAPGVSLVSSHGGLAAPGLDSVAGRVVWAAGGVHEVELAALPAVDMTGWLDLGGLTRHRLTPLDRDDRPVRPIEPPVIKPPDLRAAAGLGKPGRDLAADLDHTGRPRWQTVLIVTLIVVIALTTVALLFAAVTGQLDDTMAHSSPPAATPTGTPTASPPGTVLTLSDGPSPLGVVTVPAVPSEVITPPGSSTSYSTPLWLRIPVLIGFGLLARAVFRRLRGGDRKPSPKRAQTQRTGAQRQRGWLARLLLGSPARGFIARRHQRYLRSLTKRFEQRDWQDALTHAIALGGGGAGSGWLRLRVPSPRSSLALTAGSAGGPSYAYGPTVYVHLRDLYRDAARRIEASGNVDQAAFVHAELLADPTAAAALLERHQRYRSAAELAEARRLDVALVVRLWWRSGDRERALAIARSRGGFAAAIDRLAQVDTGTATALRAEWVAERHAAADHLGAVEAAWPDESLRQSVVADLDAGLATRGPDHGSLLAYRLALGPSAVHTDEAAELLDDPQPELRRRRDDLVAALVTVPAADPATDRRLATAATRHLVGVDKTTGSARALQTLRRRADPLVAADLPAQRRPREDEPVELMAPEAAGQLTLHDAVMIDTGSVLVAHGDSGVRLLTADGRVRARWDVPAHHLVVADQGSGALAVRRAGRFVEITRLDLETRRVRQWATLPAERIVGSYDGGMLTIVDADGIALLDVLSTGPPKVLWRELDARHRVLLLNRTPEYLTALVSVPPVTPKHEPRLHLFAWELPNMTLRVRRDIGWPESITGGAVSGSTLVLCRQGAGDDTLTYFRSYASEVITPTAPGGAVSADGAALAVYRPVGENRGLLIVDLGDRPGAVWATFPHTDAISVREHRGVVTAFDHAGRIVAADATAPLTTLRTSIAG